MSLFLLLVACSERLAPGRTESFTATIEGNDSWDAVEYVGVADVSGADRDWQLGVAVDDTTLASIDLHSPGSSDLNFLQGADVTVNLADVWGTNPRDLSVEDAEGAAFAVQIREGGITEELFGAGFASYGEEQSVGTMEDEYGDYLVSNQSVRFATDDGDVDALPGTAVELKVDGARWRAVVHTAFTVEEYPEVMPGCGGGISDTLSFEMVRVASDPALGDVAPLDGAALAGEYSCE